MNAPVAGGTGDSTPPTVAITSPASNAQVSAIVNVTADASDNIGVAGVQFLVDGVNAGVEDAAPPYALAWDTRTVSNGAHTLTARARDAAGNSTLSAPVPVNVANSSSFQNEILATGLNLPTSMLFLPDGRMLVAELPGAIKVLSPPYTSVSPTPFLQLTNVGNDGYAGLQQGIFSIALDPNFATNHYYYVFYTTRTPNRDRLSRFTANATLTTTNLNTEVVLYQDPQNADTEHHGGAIVFGNDGKLYFTTGDHFQGSPSQSLTTPRGKIHRINLDGTVPTDNPFYDGNGPNVDSIWALGLRNPFRAYYDAPTGRLYVGDVGGNDAATAKEEVNLGAAGANYGWPNNEGPCASPCKSPLYSYPHNGRDAAVTGGFVYHGTQYPSSYQGSYFFADYAQNWIKRLTFDASGNVNGVFNFEPLDGSPDGPYGDIVYLTEGPDGALYYIDLGYSDTSGTFGLSKIRRIRYLSGNLAPIAVASANPTAGPAPLAVSFSSTGSSDPEGQTLTYAWTFGDGGTSTAANPSHTYSQPGQYSARLSVSDGVNTTLSTPISISVGSPPTATILSPQDGSLFVAGDVISYSGDGTDPDVGTLPASAFTWTIDFLHEGHVHPGAAQTGVKSGTFTIPTSGHDFSGNTRYRITLTVTDSTGLTDTRSVLIYPRKVNLSFSTVPAGLTLYLDGIAKTTPFVYDTLTGFSHTVEARNQVSGGTSYTFGSWSDGGAQTHTIVVPASDQSYAATFQAAAGPAPVAAYSFDEGAGTTVADASGSGNGGTIGSATWTPSGKYGNALTFNGTSARVTVNDSASLDLTVGMTLEAWAYPTALGGWRDVIYKGQNDIYYLEGVSPGGPPAMGGTFSPSPLYGSSPLPLNCMVTRRSNLRRGDDAPLCERPSGRKQATVGPHPDIDRGAVDRRQRPLRPVLPGPHRRGSDLQRRLDAGADPGRHERAGRGARRHASADGADQSERQRRRLQPDQPQLDGLYRQRGRHRLPGGALPGCGLRDLHADCDAERGELQRHGPGGQHELQLPGASGRCRDQLERLLQRGQRHHRVRHDAAHRSHQSECHRRRLQPDQPQLDGLYRQRGRHRLPRGALPGGRLRELRPDCDAARHHLQRHGPGGQHELQLPGASGRCRDQLERLLQRGQRHDAGADHRACGRLFVQRGSGDDGWRLLGDGQHRVDRVGDLDNDGPLRRSLVL